MARLQPRAAHCSRISASGERRPRRLSGAAAQHFARDEALTDRVPNAMEPDANIASRATLRRAAWLAAAVTWLMVPAWEWWQFVEIGKLESVARYRCGTPFVAVVAVATFAMAAASSLAFAFAFLAYRKIAGPRTWANRCELAFFGLGAAACVSFACFVRFGS